MLIKRQPGQHALGERCGFSATKIMCRLARHLPEHGKVAHNHRHTVARRLDKWQAKALAFTCGNQAGRALVEILKALIAGCIEPEEILTQPDMGSKARQRVINHPARLADHHQPHRVPRGPEVIKGLKHFGVTFPWLNSAYH